MSSISKRLGSPADYEADASYRKRASKRLQAKYKKIAEKKKLRGDVYKERVYSDYTLKDGELVPF